MHSWIFIKEYSKDNNSESLLSIRLPHPRTGQAVRYILQDQTLLEIRKVDCGSQRSWFIGNTVQSDGSLFCLTPIDPLFVLVPILDTCRRKTSDSNGLFISLEDILDGEQYPSLPKLSALNNIEKYLEWVCDCQVMNSGKVVFRLNDEKVMNWLKAKISHILSNFDSFNSLKQLIQHMNNDSIDDRLRKEIRLKATIEIVMEYLPPLWRERLMAVYNFDALGRLEDEPREHRTFDLQIFFASIFNFQSQSESPSPSYLSRSTLNSHQTDATLQEFAILKITSLHESPLLDPNYCQRPLNLLARCYLNFRKEY
ncbi:5349_t:CDS:10 [Paraglomus occultum]|uniref:Ribonuclease H2 subunit B n=1 Tax=Paraglomus occultum TaxID=144539 RepID=A0A9N9ABX6_9GLOM|nr:5349_t:CDS:10 [Paraglomus occultum]